MSDFHIPVLLQETLWYLNVQKGKKYIDATLGGGGHSEEILKLGGKVLGIDVDEEALEFVERRFKTNDLRFKIGQDLVLVRGNFKDILEIARSKGFDQVDGIVFDLGVSSHQLDTPERGFSFQKEGPLDMRMDKTLEVSAIELINILTKGELHELFSKLGEERFAFAVSHNIISARRVKRIETTTELAEIVRASYPKGYVGIEPATRVFQALRIIVNDELDNLKKALPQALEVLEEGGRLVVISFHSLEDRIVKGAFNDFAGEEKGTVLTKKPITTSEEEVKVNNRSRSAKLRAFEKTQYL